MSSLAELQRGFRRAVLEGDAAAIGHLVAGDGLRPDERLAIHATNVIASLTAGLADTFPVVQRLGDPRFFAYAAQAFIRAQPPAQPCLVDYGGHFAAFLDGFPACREYPYFGDVARLEWLLHRAARAPEPPAIGAAALARVSPDAAAALGLQLQPSIGYLTSRFPVAAIWRANRDCAAAGSIDLEAGGERLEIRRFQGAVGMRPLSPAVFALRCSLHDGGTLEAAADAALAQEPDFALQPALGDLFAEGAVVALEFAR